jgi:hypothetical protein
MQLISGFSNPPRLRSLNEEAMSQCDSVEAAVAYVTDERTLIQSCIKHEIKLQLWARYDYSMPVTEAVLKLFLRQASPNYTIRIVPDIFHPKIIWWHGFGAYIGSANLTQRAWSGGIEAGVFLTDDELVEQGLGDSLRDFFKETDDRSYAVTDEFLAHVKEIESQNAKLNEEEAKSQRRLDEARKALGIERLTSTNDITRKPPADRKRMAFLKEWSTTLQILRDIARRMAAFLPSWVGEDAPVGAQADQFLHAYYYERVKDGAAAGFQRLYLQNKADPEKALMEALRWWAALPGPPTTEKEMLEEHLPVIQKLITKTRVLSLTSDEFTEVCLRVHAINNHARQASYASLGMLEPDQPQAAKDKVMQFAVWLHKQKAPRGRTALETIHHVLYGGREEEIPHRIYDVTATAENRIPRLGVSSLGELVGWVKPDFSPPRNNRTNKALRALGYDVKVYGE